MRDPIERDLLGRSTIVGGPRLTLTADELAALLGVDRKTVYHAAERGQIPGTLRLGRRVLFARATVLAWLGQGAPQRG